MPEIHLKLINKNVKTKKSAKIFTRRKDKYFKQVKKNVNKYCKTGMVLHKFKSCKGNKKTQLKYTL